ncbi:MAG: hypothetical protein K6E50_15065 [Lachnospiraceae bacterium]|nr:hypothetical protein [Lachnospiraceae bacterium]
MADIVIAYPVALAGTAALLETERERLKERFSESWLDGTAKLLKEELGRIPEEERCSTGIYEALWDRAEQEGCGLRVQLLDIPILQECVEICNELDADPYRLDCAGLIFCENGLRRCEELKRAGCRHAAAVGYTTDERKRLLYYDDVERFLTRN